MVQKSGKSNPLMNEGAGGADVPQALFYFGKVLDKLYMTVYTVYIKSKLT